MGRQTSLQVLRALTSGVTVGGGGEYSQIPEVRLDWMILHVDA